MQLKIIASCIGAAVIAAAAAHAEEKIHELRASPATVHRGFFDASLKPALTIDSGDIVRLWTTTGNPRYFESLGVPKEKIPAELYASFEGAPGERASSLGRKRVWLSPIHSEGSRLSPSGSFKWRRLRDGASRSDH